MATLANKDQQAFLFMCLDAKLAGRLSHDITATTPVLPGVVQTCFSFL